MSTINRKIKNIKVNKTTEGKKVPQFTMISSRKFQINHAISAVNKYHKKIATTKPNCLTNYPVKIHSVFFSHRRTNLTKVHHAKYTSKINIVTITSNIKMLFKPFYLYGKNEWKVYPFTVSDTNLFFTLSTDLLAFFIVDHLAFNGIHEYVR